MKKITVVVLLMASYLLLSSCGNKYFRATYEGHGSTLDFYEDGRVELRDSFFFVTTGTYEPENNKTYNVYIQTILGELTFSMKRDRNSLTLYDPENENNQLKYVLVKP